MQHLQVSKQGGMAGSGVGVFPSFPGTAVQGGFHVQAGDAAQTWR